MISKNLNKFIYTGLFFFIAASIFSIGYFHPDEHCQILDFAAYKTGRHPGQTLHWEYYEAMRPGFQPFIAYSCNKFFTALHVSNPFLQVFFLRLLSAALNFFTILSLHKALAKKYGPDFFTRPVINKAYVLLAFLSWYIPFLSVRFSSESWSMALIALAIACWLNKKSLVLTGILMGIAFLCRYQVGFMIAGFGLYLLLIEKNYKHFLLLSGGVLIAMCIGLLTDYWLYGKWIFPAYYYFEQNILAGNAANFGTYPWYFYIVRSLGFALPPYSLLIVSGVIAFFFFFPKHWLSFLLVPFLLAHFFVGHKEIRFIFPILHFIPFMLVAVFVQLGRSTRFKGLYNFLNNKIRRWVVTIFIVLNALLLCITAFRPINFSIPVQQYLWKKYRKGDEIYCMVENPYGKTSTMGFVYQKDEMNLYTVQDEVEIPAFSSEKTIYVVTQPGGYKLLHPEKYKLLYQTLPGWVVENLNFNKWVERSDTWCVYQLIK